MDVVRTQRGGTRAENVREVNGEVGDAVRQGAREVDSESNNGGIEEQGRVRSVAGQRDSGNRQTRR